MLQSDNSRETRTIEQVARVRQAMNGQSQVPNLVQTCKICEVGSKFININVEKRTRCPAKTHKDSLSTASLRRRTLSSMRVIVTSSSDGLQICQTYMNIRDPGREMRTYLPTWFIVARRHGRYFRVDGYDAL